MPDNSYKPDTHTENYGGGYRAKISGTGKSSVYYGNSNTGRHYTRHSDGSAHKHYSHNDKAASSSDGSFNDKD